MSIVNLSENEVISIITNHVVNNNKKIIANDL